MGQETSVDRRSSSRTFSPTRRDIVAVLFRRRRVFIISFALIFLAALLYAFLLPSYQSQMKVLVRRGRLDPPITPQPTGVSEFVRYDITEEEINSEVELFKDEDILRKVVLANRLEQKEQRWWKEEEEVRVARAVRHLASRLTVQPMRKTRLIVVRYQSSDPRQASQVLRSLADLYSEKHLEVRRPTGESRFFEQQAEHYQVGLEQAENRLLEMIDGPGVVVAAQERDFALQKLSEADARYREIPVAIREIRERMRALESQLAKLPERTTIEIRTSDNPLLLEKLKSQLLTLTLKRTELLTKFQPNYRVVQEVDQQIAETKEAIAAENSAPVREETTANNVDYAWAKSELEKARVELSGLYEREKAARQLMSGYAMNVRDLGRNSIKQQRLLRNAKTAEESYLLYRRKLEEARIGDALDARGIINVAMIEEPRTPALPQQSRLSILFLGLVAAMAVGSGAAFAADYAHPGFRTPAEVTALLGTPVLASLPRQKRLLAERPS
jgi:succinoglycan biosynthesis transport protein ExoP